VCGSLATKAVLANKETWEQGGSGKQENKGGAAPGKKVMWSNPEFN